MFVRSFIRHESAPQISQKPFDPDSPNLSDIHTDIVYSHTGYDDVIIYLQSGVIAKKLSKIPPPTALGGISRERFKLGSLNFTHLSRTFGLIHALEMTSLAASGPLKNVIKCCTIVPKTGPAGQKVE